MYTKNRYVKLSSGKTAVMEGEIVTEAPVSIFVNGRQAVTAMASPEMLKEYAAGFLLTEGIVSIPDEIESVQVEGTKVSIITINPRKVLFSKKTVLSGCGGTSSVVDYSGLPSAPGGNIFSKERIIGAVSELKSYMKEEKTGEIYFAGLFSTTGTVAFAGDIGRDTALDKVFGAAFFGDIQLSGCFAAVSGRISSEMIRKCLFAQVPVIVSEGAPTSLACEIASERDVTLAGMVSSSGMNLYSGEHRIEGAGQHL